MLAAHLLVIIHLFTHKILCQTLSLLLSNYRRCPNCSYVFASSICIRLSILTETQQFTLQNFTIAIIVWQQKVRTHEKETQKALQALHKQLTIN